MKDSPHFWLQYGMACMFLKDYPRAKQYFDNAYGSAEKDRYQYNVAYIDDQVAAWHLTYALQKDDPKEIFSHINGSYHLMKNQDFGYYFFMRIKQLGLLYEYKFEVLNKSNKTQFEKWLKNLKQRFGKESYLDNARLAAECEEQLNKIIDEIVENRANPVKNQ